MHTLRTLYNIMPVVAGLSVVTLLASAFFAHAEGQSLAPHFWLLLVSCAFWGMATTRQHLDGRQANGQAKTREHLGWLLYVFALFGLTLVAITYAKSIDHTFLQEWGAGFWLFGLFYSALLSPFVERLLFAPHKKTA